MAVVVAAFVSPPAFVYIAIGCYSLFLGPPIPRGGRPVAGVGFNSLALVFVGGIHRHPPRSLTPPPPCRGPPPACLAPSLLFLSPVSPLLLLLLTLPCRFTPPLSLLYSLPHIPPSMDPLSSKTKPPTSLWKGRDGWGYILASEGELRPY